MSKTTLVETLEFGQPVAETTVTIDTLITDGVRQEAFWDSKKSASINALNAEAINDINVIKDTNSLKIEPYGPTGSKIIKELPSQLGPFKNIKLAQVESSSSRKEGANSGKKLWVRKIRAVDLRALKINLEQVKGKRRGEPIEDREGSIKKKGKVIVEGEDSAVVNKCSSREEGLILAIESTDDQNANSRAAGLLTQLRFQPQWRKKTY
ncbi:hypothetical protein QYF36_026754 [Acer negundo]|nr:hypothetical protein QYF36_026754 [Acer negundo]